MIYDYGAFSRLTGPLQEVARGEKYTVAYRKVMVGPELWMILPLLVITAGLSSLFFAWLIQPAHYPHTAFLPTPVRIGNAVMFWTIVVTEGLRLLNSFTLCWAAAVMRNPVPVEPPTGLRVAFTTTIVPTKEPLDVVRDTLIAARQLRYSALIDIWLLDEGDDPGVRLMCKDLGVHHFTRKGVEKWNQPKGPFRAKTKHGNHNAWLDAHGDAYDVVLSVDPDHIPLPNFGRRMLGYFRDEDVAFVVGPQVYGNFRSFLTRGAEAQNYMFHSVIQRAANRFDAGMFVGTNHAYRVATWRQIGGFNDSITEDLATSFAVHGAHNPATGRRWKSVYTPDVVAVGEGPATWTDFFSQQLRWARGSNEVMVTESPRRMRKLSWPQRFHYAMLMVHYPTVAITWLLGTVLTLGYMALGSTGIKVHVSSWLALYFDVALARLMLYIWLRRFNISPHEEQGTAGISGIFVSVLCTPFYSTALTGALLRRPLGFVVTPKGDSASPDRLMTFRKHIFWAVVAAGGLAGAAVFNHVYPANIVWAALSFITCVLPILLWAGGNALARRRPAARPLTRLAGTGPVPAATGPRDLFEANTSPSPTTGWAKAPRLSYLEDTTLTLVRPVFAPAPRGGGDPVGSPVDGPTVIVKTPVGADAASAAGPRAKAARAPRPPARAVSAQLDPATMKITPRRRRVSPDGTVETLTDPDEGDVREASTP